MTPPSATNTADKSGKTPRLAVLGLSRGGCTLGQRLAAELDGDFFACKGKVAVELTRAWPVYDALICIMATGIVVRTIAPLLADKYQDPAVVVCDELGHFAIPLISGHLGGANQLAIRVAAITGGQAVLTTASDVLGRTALDLWCRDHGLTPADKDGFTRAMGRLVDQGELSLWSCCPLPALPPDLVEAAERTQADLIIDIRRESGDRGAWLIPRMLVLGVGCNRGTSMHAISKAVQATCAQENIAFQAISRLASIDLKIDEAGLLEFAAAHRLPLDFYSKDQLNQVENTATSAAVFAATGAKGVAEPAALLSAGDHAQLLVPKKKWTDVTTAIAAIAGPLNTNGKEPLS